MLPQMHYSILYGQAISRCVHVPPLVYPSVCCARLGRFHVLAGVK